MDMLGAFLTVTLILLIFSKTYRRSLGYMAYDFLKGFNDAKGRDYD